MVAHSCCPTPWKINITLPHRLLAKIDAYAKARGETRSGFLAEAARAAMR
ncbi:MAG: type II toxin-antitoxin system HicB family antitoxin [Candidatus Competibacter denitrificans]